jgi:hypothetical protein
MSAMGDLQTSLNVEWSTNLVDWQAVNQRPASFEYRSTEVPFERARFYRAVESP